MRRDTIKTVGAILLIVAIVGITFWYGNRQRQQQIKHDQQVAAQSNQTIKSSSTTSKSSTATTKSTASTTPKANPTPAPSPKVAYTPPTASPTPAPAAGTVTPQSTNPSAQPTSIPQTGGELGFIVPVAALVIGYQVKRASDRSLRRAQMSI